MTYDMEKVGSVNDGLYSKLVLIESWSYKGVGLNSDTYMQWKEMFVTENKSGLNSEAYIQ